ncbi:hypothetical protein IWX49DRAFT_32804 [Phyllosticta citricarpa]|uniref:Secreted protein n=1 Tax=Phyllosticta paracitricarpa TaxID=2016321 RepID=A0ABR1N9I1_9PEZI
MSGAVLAWCFFFPVCRFSPPTSHSYLCRRRRRPPTALIVVSEPNVDRQPTEVVQQLARNCRPGVRLTSLGCLM